MELRQEERGGASGSAGREQEGELFISAPSLTVWLPTRAKCAEWTGSTPSHQGNTSALHQILLPLHSTILFAALSTPFFPRIYFPPDDLFLETVFFVFILRASLLIPESSQNIYKNIFK